MGMSQDPKDLQRQFYKALSKEEEEETDQGRAGRITSASGQA